MRIELSRRAVMDLSSMGAERTRVQALLMTLGRDPRPANLDLKPLAGKAPWSRARVGPYRVIFRPLDRDEATKLGLSGQRGYLVARIVHRRDLERTVAGL